PRQPFLQQMSTSVSSSSGAARANGAAPSPVVQLNEELGQQVRNAAQALQDATVGRTASSTAFVTLRSIGRSTEAQQVVLGHEGNWRVRGAAEPRDLLWCNVWKPLQQVEMRHSLALVACTFGLLFWSVPVTLIQAWASIGMLKKWFPAVERLQAIPNLYSFLTNYLPAVALIGLQALLPSVFEGMASRWEGHKTKSEVQRVVLNRCFSYQLASLYVTVLSGSLWDSLQSILDHPGNVLGILSQSLPKVAVYFLTFVLARACSGLPILLLRPWVFCCGAGSRPTGWEESPGRAAAVEHCQLGSEAASAALVLVIGLTYSIIAPVILPACALYFGLASLSYRWLFTYVYEPEFDSCGMFWYDLFSSILVGLLLGTLSLVGLALIYGNYAQFVALLPLPVLVLRLGWRCTSQGLQCMWIPLEDAVAADQDEGAAIASFSEELYARPDRE
ncbi:unnamed protein product, partial [Polarella glacialis]